MTKNSFPERQTCTSIFVSFYSIYLSNYISFLWFIPLDTFSFSLPGLSSSIPPPTDCSVKCMIVKLSNYQLLWRHSVTWILFFFYHMNRQTTDLSFHFSPLTLFFHHLLPPVTFQVEVHDRRAPHHSQPPEATGRLDETAGWDEHQGSVKWFHPGLHRLQRQGQRMSWWGHTE